MLLLRLPVVPFIPTITITMVELLRDNVLWIVLALAVVTAGLGQWSVDEW